MWFVVAGAAGWTASLPTNLRSKTASITRLAGLTPNRQRNMSLVEVHNIWDSPTMVTMNNQTFMASETLMTTDAMAVKSNTLGEWLLINTTIDAHPMHLHYAQFQVMDRQPFDSTQYAIDAGYVLADGTTSTGPNTGVLPPPDVTNYLSKTDSPTAPAANEMGWKDTILCPPGQVTRIRVPFGPNAVPGKPMAIGTAYTGNFVSHCHILEHEENDMMTRFRIM